MTPQRRKLNFQNISRLYDKYVKQVHSYTPAYDTVLAVFALQQEREFLF